MGAWSVVGDIAGPAAAGAVLVVLVWAAIERGRMHHTNMTYAGTLVTHGRGQAVVVSTGMSTEFGHIARMVETVETGRTPLQENLDRLGATLGKAALVVVALVIALGLWRGLPPVEMFMFGIALAVAVVPEAPARGRDDLARDRPATDGQRRFRLYP